MFTHDVRELVESKGFLFAEACDDEDIPPPSKHFVYVAKCVKVHAFPPSGARGHTRPEGSPCPEGRVERAVTEKQSRECNRQLDRALPLVSRRFG
ncbi:hypothetical protein GCM10009687_60290 [Asanoa iriomotensis]|uniref:Uncharacterized protein n=1 Tax=Asanoa iriomotensis TaxID=234613 RepID=A0ABQ4CFD4_9ACTN|nr:hypothetical protein Air01nite_75770 [Asanoa iriomotensis]